MEDSGFVATGGAVDDFHVVVDELGGEISTRSEVDQSDLLFLRAIQEVAPVGVGLFIKAKVEKESEQVKRISRKPSSSCKENETSTLANLHASPLEQFCESESENCFTYQVPRLKILQFAHSVERDAWRQKMHEEKMA